MGRLGKAELWLITSRGVPSPPSSLAIVLRELGQFDEAWELGVDSLDRFAMVLGVHHPSTFVFVVNLTTNLRELGQFDEVVGAGIPCILNLKQARDLQG